MHSFIKPNTLDRQCAKVGQVVFYIEVVAVGPERLRVDIRSGVSKDTGSAKISLWSGGQWQFLHAILPTLMSTPEGLSNVPPQSEEDRVANFAEDRDQLLKVVQGVLFTE